MAGVTLVRSEPGPLNVYRLAAYRLRVDAVDPVGFDGAVFVFHRGPVNPYTTQATDTFETVVGPAELGSIPVGAPDPDATGHWFFRVPSAELDFWSTAQAEDAWRLIRDRVAVLVEALGRLARLRVTEEVRLGDPAEAGSYS